MDLDSLLSPKAAPVTAAAEKPKINPKTILTARSSRAAILEHYHNGLGNGETTRFHDLDKYWTWKRGELTVATGYPNHGKSEFVIQLMVFKAAFDGWKFAMFCPENFPAEDVYIKIIQMYIGGSANRKEKGKPHYMTEADLERGIQFADKHFFLLSPENEEEEFTPAQVLAYFDYIHKQHGLDGVMLDPWNQLDHDDTGGIRSDQYLRKWLTKLKRFAQKRQICFFVTAHPAGDVTDKASGELRVPKAYNISDGKMWHNKSDNVFAVHRPKFPESTTEIWIHKIKKWGLVGRAGMLVLDYKPEANRYFAPTGSRNPLDKMNPPVGPEREALAVYSVNTLPDSTFDHDIKNPKQAPF
jgi:DnaB-like helicase C terminal domain